MHRLDDVSGIFVWLLLALPPPPQPWSLSLGGLTQMDSSVGLLVTWLLKLHPMKVPAGNSRMRGDEVGVFIPNFSMLGHPRLDASLSCSFLLPALGMVLFYPSRVFVLFSAFMNCPFTKPL
jgi:hypothetical protein